MAQRLLHQWLILEVFCLTKFSVQGTQFKVPKTGPIWTSTSDIQLPYCVRVQHCMIIAPRHGWMQQGASRASHRCKQEYVGIGLQLMMHIVHMKIFTLVAIGYCSSQLYGLWIIWQVTQLPVHYQPLIPAA
jgi:hypothetical protein